jgi:uncharacterized protein YdbL (DUF1318 family)
MNRKPLFTTTTLALALLGSGAAFAQEASSDAWMQAAATKSRAQVQAELQQARKDGTIRATAAGYMTPFKAVATRADVHTEVMTALRSGELERIDAEAHAFVTPRGQVASTVLAGK